MGIRTIGVHAPLSKKFLVKGICATYSIVHSMSVTSRALHHYPDDAYTPDLKAVEEAA